MIQRGLRLGGRVAVVVVVAQGDDTASGRQGDAGDDG